MATVNTDIAQELDITCRRGDSFALSISFKATDGTTPIDISNYTFRMEVREEDTDDGPNPVLSADKCVIEVTSGTNGQVSVSIDKSDMATVVGGTYVYDIQATVGINTTTWVAGSFTVNEEVTVGYNAL